VKLIIIAVLALFFALELFWLARWPRGLTMLMLLIAVGLLSLTIYLASK
jgi:hypothetical protein